MGLPPMDPQNDPLWQIGKQGEQQNLQRAQQRMQGWANKEQYYQRQLVDGALSNTYKLGEKLYKDIRCVFFVYVAPVIGVGLARTSFKGAIALQQDKGFFDLGLALGLVDAILFLIGAAFAIATLAAIVWAFRSMTWVGKILAMFFGYSVLAWWIHHWEAGAGWKAAGAWFFCIVLSSIIEGINLAFQRRQAGPAI